MSSLNLVSIHELHQAGVIIRGYLLVSLIYANTSSYVVNVAIVVLQTVRDVMDIMPTHLV